MNEIKKKRIEEFEREHKMLTDVDKKKESNGKYKKRYVQDMYKNYYRWQRRD